jgi:hypothetical protein
MKIVINGSLSLRQLNHTFGAAAQTFFVNNFILFGSKANNVSAPGTGPPGGKISIYYQKVSGQLFLLSFFFIFFDFFQALNVKKIQYKYTYNFE